MRAARSGRYWIGSPLIMHTVRRHNLGKSGTGQPAGPKRRDHLLMRLLSGRPVNPRPASRAGLHAADEPAQSEFTLRRAFVLLGKAGESIGLALALFGSQVRHARRVLLPVGMAVDLRIAEDSGIDADWRTGQHGEIKRVTRTGIDLDDPCRGLDNYHGIEDAFDQASDSHLGQP